MLNFKFLSILLLLTLCIILACSTPKLSPIDYKGNQIHFGQGGGFTGNVNYYVILDDGRLFQKQLKDTSFSHLATWKRNFTHQLFTDYDQLELDTLAYSEPGNLYYFVEMHNEGKIHRSVWGKPGFNPSQKLVDFYNILYKSTAPKS